MSDLSKKLAGLSPEKRALLLKKLQKEGKGAKKNVIQKRADTSVFPMSFAQKRLWFMHQMEPDSPFYNIPFAIRLKSHSEKLNIEVLREALNNIIARHEVLRATFVTDRNEPIQRISPSLELDLNVTDLERYEPIEREKQVHRLATQEAVKPFDLATGPLIRGSLLRLHGNEHVLLLTFHHIVADGGSVNILIYEMLAQYRAMGQGQQSPLKPLEIQYADFAAWQRAHLEGENMDKQLSFWKEKLQGMPPILELPIDKSRPAVQRFGGKRYLFTLPGEISERIKDLGQKESVTPFMTFLAAFQVFLHRISGQRDFGVGTPIANRQGSQTEQLIGFFVNSLVIRAKFEHEVSFRGILKETREFALGAYSNQDVPFEKVVEALLPKRDITHTPLFQVMFDLQGDALQQLKLPGMEVEVIEPEIQTAKFDLLLILQDLAGQTGGFFEYNTDIFDDETIQNFAATFKTLLDEIVKNPDKPISELSLLSAQERTKILKDWNTTGREYPRESTVEELFEQKAKATPDAIAIEFDGRKITYQEVDEKANRIANFLRRLGIETGSLVAIFMERSSDLFSCMLGILKAGAVYVPMDTAYPKARIGLMLEDTKASVLLTQESLLESLPESNAKLVCLDRDWRKITGESAEKPKSGRQSGDPAYIIYTSGSTGIPKGVVVPHRAIVRLVINTDYIPLDSGDRIAQVSNASFDAATFEIWGAFLNGGTLVAMPKDIVLSSREFVKQLRESQITALFLTTALFNQLSNDAPGAFSSLKTLMFGGEACDPGAIRKVLENDPPNRLLHVYGPTENTTFSTWYWVKQVRENATTVPIGRPVANSTMYVLDANRQPVPVGVPGELYVGGDGLALGYFNRPELTAERFIESPFGIDQSTHLYKTGDLVRYLSDGNVEFLDRIDHQIKLRGFRIELGEIESALRSHSAIKDSVVLAREDIPGNRQLAAYLIAKDGQLPGSSELRQFLQEKLPDYMIPSFFVQMETFPINPNGKVDRKAFPVPEQTRPDSAKAYVEPRTALEKYLAGLWQEILNVPKIGIYDDFFELGGNSIQAAVFINRLQKEFNQEAQVRSVFLAPTVAEFAMYVNEYYPEMVKERFGEVEISSVELKDKLTDGKLSSSIIDETIIAQFRSTIVPLGSRKIVSRKKNPPAIFLLSPPRSGSTLLRVMLAGNPRLFSPPELELLSFNNLQERKTELSRQYSLWLEATVRAIMELKSCSAEKAETLMRELEGQSLPVNEFYALLQEWMGERILVDKTPTYALDMNVLRRAEEDFENTLYIHLKRHPYASIYSFLEAKLDQNFFRYEHDFGRRELAELIWMVCHDNILEFLSSIPKERQYALKFEQLVSDPQDVLEGLCGFIGIDYHPDMMKPYHGKKMTDPVKKSSQMVGDFKFYLRKKIDTEVIDRWKKFHTQDFLSNSSWDIAVRLGYKKEKTVPEKGTHRSLTEIKPVSRDESLPLSFAQQRLWFLDQLEPQNPFYSIISGIRLLGNLDEDALQKSLSEIVRRHEILRSNFLTEDGKAVLKILPAIQVTFNKIDLRKSSEANLDYEIVNLANAEAKKPFSLSECPLFRVLLIQVKDDEHVLILTIHHIIADGWSIGLFNQEIARLYNGFARGHMPNLPNLRIQYADYAYWQRNWLQGEVLQQQLDFWKVQLSNSPALLELPLDHSRPMEQGHKGERFYFELESDIYLAIQKLSRAENVTTYMVLLAAFYVLLYRYTGQEDINVGTPVAGRNRVETESLIGFFVNTLVLRGNLSGNPDFSTLLKRLKKMTMESFANQDVPFEKLVDMLVPERDMSYAPLFQVMFAYNKSEFQRLEMEGLTFKPMLMDTGTSKFDLTLEILEKKDNFRAAIEYNTALFDRQTINRIVQHFGNILEAALHHPNQSISEIPILADSEKAIYQQWNDTPKPNPTNPTFVALFEKQVAATPDADAVVFGENVLSYQELNSRANRIATYLKNMGVGPEHLVGVLMERSVEMVVALVGILKAGAAYVPLDISYPSERLEFILNDANISVLLTQAEIKNEFDMSISFAQNKVSSGANKPSSVNRHQNLSVPGNSLSEVNGNVKLICLDADWDKIAAQSNENFESGVMPENAAYVIFTSGSTGRPKGVVISHRSMIHLYTALNDKIYNRYPGRKLRMSLNAPIMFDASVQQLVQLLGGHTLYVLPHEVRGSGHAMLQFIQDHRLEVLDCVPSQLKLLLSAGLHENIWKPKICLPGGEAIDTATWKQLVENKGIDYFNMYGPTECSVDSIVSFVNQYPGKPVIGKPMANMEVWILDKSLQPVPVGVAGEIFLGGLGVGRGYLNRPDLTADRFLPNPFGKKSGERIYRSGDVGRWLPDGNIEYLGRADFQVKVRGFRIELGEIEAALRTHSSLRDIVVMVREYTPGEKKLVGYLVANTEMTKPTVSELRKFLKDRLPEYMVPSIFMFLDEMPLTPNGKIDRKSLPVPEVDRSSLGGEFLAPRTEREMVLVEIWKQILNLKEVGIRDNFFELGGDSILSIQVISRAAQSGLRLTPRQLFQFPTIEGLALQAQTTKSVKAEQGIVTGRVPLTPIQQHFFDLELKNPHHWNQSILLEMPAGTQPAMLGTAFRHLIAHHDMLRASYLYEKNGWIQHIVEPPEELPFSRIDLSNIPEEDQRIVLESSTASLQARLNIETGPVWRAAYFNLGINRPGRLFITIHHLVVDGVSWRIILEDLGRLYLEEKAAEPKIKLPAKTTSFKNWADKLSEYCGSTDLMEDANYWISAGTKKTGQLPFDFPGIGSGKNSSEYISILFETNVTQALMKDVPKAYNTQINDVLLTALMRAFSHWTGKRNLLIAMEGHGREDLFTDVDVSRTVGWFTSMYPVILNLGKAVTIGDQLVAIKEQLRAIPGNGISYGLLSNYFRENNEVAALQLLRNAEISFNYLGQFSQNNAANDYFKIAQEAVGEERSIFNKREFAIDVSGSIRDGQLVIRWDYDADRFRSETISSLASNFKEELISLINFCANETAGGYTPSDFREAEMTENDFENLISELEDDFDDE